MYKTPIFERLSERPFAHCATLIDLGDAGLLAAWMGGAYETAPDVAILAAQLPLGQEIWTFPRILAEVPGHSLGQPVFLRRPQGELWLFFVVIQQKDWTSAIPYLTKSMDGGATWSEPKLLIDLPGLMLRSRALVLQDRILLPAYDENTWQSRMIVSDDQGKTWHLTAPMQSPDGNIHPTIVQRDDGCLMAYLRTGSQGGVIWRSESVDGGETWSELTRTQIPNPNSGLDLLGLKSGRLALAFNNSPRLRTPLCVALSEEDEAWPWMRVIEDEYGEMSYPTLAQTSDGLLHLVYTYKREHIRYARFSEAWLMGGAFNR